MDSLPRHRLPDTFRDAVSTANTLGIKYIWIDSLCIIRDDDADWDTEAAQVSSVYGRSYINIAASSVQNPHDGFSGHKSLNDGLRVKIEVRGDGDLSKMLQFEPSDRYHRIVWRSYLAARAWTFQETVLSPRTAHFSHRVVFWEGGTLIANESLPDGLLRQNRDGYDSGLVRQLR